MLLALLLFKGLAIELVAKSCLTFLGQNQNCSFAYTVWCIYRSRANRFNIKLVMKGHQVYLAYEGCGVSVIWL